ncbi:hypothetical protein KNP414_04314 [Paenibacillus mucilaginosus KNP414]|uniref:Uncharacterized protein n=1 Tax=Paenibacillus mucilaginosus (strain KNP414) TaxID=1036673 RepID=F8FJJ6_PAEMK|nr:hypothetical protein KNP414_04314 [Paenibacillus mucilaginosus KNP414]
MDRIPPAVKLIQVFYHDVSIRTTAAAATRRDFVDMLKGAAAMQLLLRTQRGFSYFSSYV